MTITSDASVISCCITLFCTGVKPVKPSKTITLSFITLDFGRALLSKSSVSSVVMYFSSIYFKKPLYKVCKSLNLYASAPRLDAYSQSFSTSVGLSPYCINSDSADLTSCM